MRQTVFAPAKGPPVAIKFLTPKGVNVIQHPRFAVERFRYRQDNSDVPEPRIQLDSCGPSERRRQRRHIPRQYSRVIGPLQ